MKKSLKVALAAVCLIAAGAFFMGCANPNGGETSSGSGSGSSSGAGTGSGTGSGGTGGSGSSGGGVTYIGKKAPGTALSVGDIVFNDGSATPYSEIDERTEKECTEEEKAAAIAVIFKVGDGAKGNKTLGVGIKHKRKGAGWCKDNTVKGYFTDFIEETKCVPDGGSKAPNLTFQNSLNTDGSENLAKMIKKLDSNNDTGIICNTDGTINFESSTQETLKTKYPAFEFAYYYGKNEGHNITSGSYFETGWYLPSLSELNDIYQANKTVGVIENALYVTGGDKFDSSSYWSSSQSHSSSSSAAVLQFSDGDWSNPYKNSFAEPFIYYVCAIRAFN